jgi:hypothetical protein
MRSSAEPGMRADAALLALTARRTARRSLQ